MIFIFAPAIGYNNKNVIKISRDSQNDTNNNIGSQNTFENSVSANVMLLNLAITSLVLIGTINK